MKIALISDTHLTPDGPLFDANLAAARAYVVDRQLPLTVHLGDISADGAIVPAQLDHAASALHNWPGILKTLPGNHDIGDNPGDNDHPPVDVPRRAAYGARFGSDRWTIVEQRWTMIGLNAQLFGGSDAAEAEQNDWLDDVLDAISGPVGIFIHKPLFRDGPSDSELHHRYIPAPARAALVQRLRRVDLRFVASGHTHQSRRLIVSGVEHIWVPSTAFVLPGAMQETIGVKQVGMMVLTLTAEDHRFALVQPPGMVRHNLADHPQVYPAHADRLRAMVRDDE